MTDRGSYAPGWGADVMAMVSARTADDRAAFALPFVATGARLLDVGCGPGTITLGLARHVGEQGEVVGIDMQPSQTERAARDAAAQGIAHASFLVANAAALPFGDASFDAVFAHALFEHLSSPAAVLAEMARVLRPGGLLAVCSSDWSGARVEPETADVRIALRAHWELRRRGGADPFAGARLSEWVAAGGFGAVAAGAEHKVDMTYGDLGAYIESRVHAALAASPGNSSLEEAAAAASRWAASGNAGIALQRWAHVVARRP